MRDNTPIHAPSPPTVTIRATSAPGDSLFQGAVLEGIVVPGTVILDTASQDIASQDIASQDTAFPDSASPDDERGSGDHSRRRGQD
jgi:hypothetical protein